MGLSKAQRETPGAEEAGGPLSSDAPSSLSNRSQKPLARSPGKCSSQEKGRRALKELWQHPPTARLPSPGQPTLVPPLHQLVLSTHGRPGTELGAGDSRKQAKIPALKKSVLEMLALIGREIIK